MAVPRPLYLVLSALLVALAGGCQKHADEGTPPETSSHPRISLEGVDTTQLTAREHRSWSAYVSELLAPCAEVAVPIAQCVKEARACDVCVDAARFVLRQVQAGRSEAEVKEMYAARFDPARVKTIVEDGSPALGPDDAPVVMVEFADFECGACRAAYPLLDEMKVRFEGKLRFVFKHYPLPSHAHSKGAARASHAAHQQQKFWEMHHKMFDNQLQLTEADLMRYAAELGLDVDQFRRDLASDAAKERVEKDLSQAKGLGVEFTPTVFINGRFVDLSKLGDPLVDLEQWIALEIKMTGKKGSDGEGAEPSASAAPAVSSSAAPAASAAPTGAASAAP